ncbi:MULTISPECIES: AraC family transcriptional regulator [unclassified Pseudomonas]|uniref:AraC family transcriptional regulator n=1 Tax=unclassified Pseudomonas TaxID=196821 RepID=UPI00244C3ED5|nr:MULTISPECIES: AraC family transcriptional regulator [unclassified Pseudomonas]MDG9930356.1 AraC family transcriptional regulator [Pseudomonas sp. GD04042]MDH0484531.1 AraC family transcriptional regulator [Pseudomonas sp. GD04015]MDH0606011.1 AraC family transcriptional regulator [Pseudomonas sp. GD03869]
MPPSDAPVLLYLWDKRTFYLSAFDEPLRLSQAAAMLLVALDGELAIHCRDNELACRSALLPAGLDLVVDSRGSRVAIIYLDVFGEDHALLLPRMESRHGPVHFALGEEAACIADFDDLHRRIASPPEAYDWLERLINPQQRPPPGFACDPRIVRAVQLIKADVACNQSIEFLAEQVGLSVPRLTQLFRQKIGIPIRRYRQWHRLFVTSVGVARGMNLTDAAMAAGFTDSAHFSHTFRTIIGMSPSAALAQPRGIRLFAG